MSLYNFIAKHYKSPSLNRNIVLDTGANLGTKSIPIASALDLKLFAIRAPKEKSLFFGECCC